MQTSHVDGHGKHGLLFDEIRSPIARALQVYFEGDSKIYSGKTVAEFKKVLVDYSTTTIIFDVPDVNEGQLLDDQLAGVFDGDELSRRIYSSIESMMERCRAIVATASIMADEVHVWAICIDDVASRQYGIKETPILNQARLSCFKALAKEYGRMGICFNTCVIHPTKEMLTPDQQKKSRAVMKSYALRYKPQGSAEVAVVLAKLLEIKDISMNGVVLYLGNGNTEIGS